MTISSFPKSLMDFKINFMASQLSVFADIMTFMVGYCLQQNMKIAKKYTS